MDTTRQKIVAARLVDVYFAVFIPENYKIYVALAGLLTYPLAGLPSHGYSTTVARLIRQVLCRTHSSGSVRDFHPIPFSSHERNQNVMQS